MRIFSCDRQSHSHLGFYKKYTALTFLRRASETDVHERNIEINTSILFAVDISHCIQSWIYFIRLKYFIATQSS